MNERAIERYRHAVAEKSKAEEYRRTAVQHCDTYRAIHRLAHWTQEVKDALAALGETSFDMGVQDGLEQGEDFSSGMTWDDPSKNEAYDAGVNLGQARARKTGG